MFGLAIGICGGLLLPVQTCINSRLRESVGSPFLSSLGSFTGGTLFLVFLTLLMDRSLLFSSTVLTREPAWIWLGGVLGVVGLTTNIFVFPQLGGVQTTVLPIAGQIIMGLVIDHFGLFSARQDSLTLLKMLGALLVLGGVLGAVLIGSAASRSLKVAGHGSQLKRDTAKENNLWGWRVLALFSGFLMASQSAINGHLGVVIGSSIRAALVSFTVGTVLLLFIALALRLQFRVSIPAGKNYNPRWMWLGGPLGALYVFANAALVPVLGTGLTVMATLVGMIAGSLIVDKFGILQAQKNPVSIFQVLSLLVMLAGVSLIRLT